MKRLVAVGCITGLALLAAVLWLSSSGAGGARAAGSSPVTPDSPAISGISYQGRLLDGAGRPVSGLRDLEFRFYDAESAVAPQQVFTQTVEISDGLFDLVLPVDPLHFDGRQLWLGIRVQGDAEMVPRQPILPVPYAFSLRPGAVISASLNLDNSAGVLHLENTDASTTGGYALSALNYSGNTWRPAIYGENRGASAGVYGRSDGWHAVVGWNVSDDNAGVWGNNVGSGYGVRGDSTAGYGLYSGGDAHVEGQLTWKAVTSYLSIPAADFQPSEDGYNYLVDTTAVQNFSSATEHFIAPVHLPHGATITKLTFYWVDNSSSNGNLAMYSNNLQMTQTEMATADSNGQSTAPGSSQDTSIVYAQVDNRLRTYYLWLTLPDSNVYGIGAVIEYTITGPY
jgi:hypothetical protein